MGLLNDGTISTSQRFPYSTSYRPLVLFTGLTTLLGGGLFYGPQYNKTLIHCDGIISVLILLWLCPRKISEVSSPDIWHFPNHSAGHHFFFFFSAFLLQGFFLSLVYN